LGIFLYVRRAWLAEPYERRYLDREEIFADGSFAPGGKGALGRKTKRGKIRRWVVVVDGQAGFLGSTLSSALPAEVGLITD
jgi:hypothetical protein